MKINEFTSLITPRVLLVPYSTHHVPIYHEWMQDEEIQQATASEPLTLDEEYSMQQSWRTDADKLTFIVCTHPGEQFYDEITRSTQIASISPGKQDAPDWMVGDVNLFLSDDDEEDEEGKVDEEGNEDKPKSVIGELEIMIARKDQQGKGLAQETLRAFMSYIQSSLPSILLEYAGERDVVLKYLRVKIDKDNVRSLKLFERVGFVRTSVEPNYFGEVELRTPVVEEILKDVEGRIGLVGSGKTLKYEAADSQ
ncbi:acyl-CoA N-acyltransferase [Boeremia exigua]|uniref:acyl-CoA N-acyltransferase n=1 Tax=Boeremia exigua TaxID=749465 RepID=UPI001E8DCB08|nr:acyl-CoA N-acyltransferase [Boeremia exigua]KAH6612695.1 acyl-CoA N-acyltransferase [Boeremia exigua]